MTICGSYTCNCGIISNSLTVTGSGATGSPFQIETLQGQVVTSGTRPAAPVNGMQIYETDTDRLLVYNGTNWVIVGGNWPGAQLEQQVAQSIPDGTGGTTVTLPTEIYDTDGFHTGTNGFATIPAGLGGDYWVEAFGQFASSATGFRFIRPVLANNTVVTQNNGSRAGGSAMAATASNGFPITELFRLEPGATITLTAVQTSGGALDLNAASLKLIMVRHDPSLT